MLPWPTALLLTTLVVKSSGRGGAAVGLSAALPSVIHVGTQYYGAVEERKSKQELGRGFQANLRRRKRYVIRKKRWHHNNLTWRLDRSHVKDEDEFVVRTTLHRAFQEWSSVAGVRFEEVFEQPADISIGFEQGKHEDAFPFDGKDGIVAHAFYPRDGRLHFDADEDWSLNTPIGVNLYQTAMHEIGHILGLEHSVDPRAVMYAVKRPYNPDFALGELRPMTWVKRYVAVELSTDPKKETNAGRFVCMLTLCMTFLDFTKERLKAKVGNPTDIRMETVADLGTGVVQIMNKIIADLLGKGAYVTIVIRNEVDRQAQQDCVLYSRCLDVAECAHVCV